MGGYDQGRVGGYDECVMQCDVMIHDGMNLISLVGMIAGFVGGYDRVRRWWVRSRDLLVGMIEGVVDGYY